jgi:hypothetical protein
MIDENSMVWCWWLGLFLRNTESSICILLKISNIGNNSEFSTPAL